MDCFFELKTHRLAYRLQETPGKEQVLFLHGLGANHTQYEREFALLAENFSVAALSLRGQGKSTRPPGDHPEDMTIAALASDVIQWMQAQRWDQPHVVACSMGGVVALEVLRQRSQSFKSLVTFGTTPKLSFPKTAIKVAAWLSDLLLPGLFPHWMARTMPKTTSDKPEAQQRFAADLRTAYGQRTTIYQLRCNIANYDYTQVLKTSTIPVLLLQGAKDSAVNKEVAKLWPLLKTNPLLHWEFLEDAGHIANYDQPEAFSKRIIQFLEGQAS